MMGRLSATLFLLGIQGIVAFLPPTVNLPLPLEVMSAKQASRPQASSSALSATSRRDALLLGVAGFLSLGGDPPTARAADTEGKTVYLTGKAPKVPGQKPKDKNDVSGTRKDPNFLRSISDCKSQCENANGPTKTKEEWCVFIPMECVDHAL